jgi:hypothetical protein
MKNLIQKTQNYQLIQSALKSDIKTTIIHSEKLNYNKQYIFSLHPHANWAFGSTIMASSGLLNFHIFQVVDKMVFNIPLIREIAKYFYIVPCDKVFIQNILNNKYSIIITPGSTEEMIRTESHKETVYISNRTGIFHLAIKNKIEIVPILCYGESDSQYNLNSTNSLNIKKRLKKIFGMYLQSAFGFKSVKLEFVIGNPIYDVDVNQFKNMYINELKRMRKEHPPSDVTRDFILI